MLFPLSVKLAQLGSAPTTDQLSGTCVGVPFAAAEPSIAAILFCPAVQSIFWLAGIVGNRGNATVSFSIKLASVKPGALAVMAQAEEQDSAAPVGMPLTVAVPLPLSVKVMPG